jgi:phosphoribosylglycinamide formyltransferase-1
MISGGGRTLVNLLDRIADGSLAARVPLVIASRECPGAERAREGGVETVLVERGRIPATRLGSLLDEHRIDWVILAGYLHLVEIPPGFGGRVVNIHPALLPEFGGAGMHGRRVHEAVLAAGRCESGCTVHLCDAEYDGGPIVLQMRCPVRPGDTPETLAARVFGLELEAYPEALRMLFARAREGGALR